MMWDTIGGQDMSNTMQRSHSRSPQPSHKRMPSPAFPVPETNATIGPSFFSSSNSLYPPSQNYKSYVSHGYPSVPHAAPAPFPPTQIVHIHHSKHHSSSKNKHHHKQSGHDHGHSHSHSHSQHHLPSPSPMTSFPFPITPSTSYPPQINFPTVPHRPPIQSSSSNILRKLPSPGYIQSKPPPKQSTKHIPKHLHKPNYLSSMPHYHTASPTGPPINHDFQYSNCTGRRRALCIGINYRGQENELRGCINDANNVRKFLRKHNYKSDEIMLLTDETNDSRTLPTRNNILEGMRWLVHGAKPHDSLFLHYSGHGGQTPDLDGDEADGMDEVIYPLDFKQNGHIVDDLMHDILVRPLPRGCRLTGLFDACHSGSVLDLPYDYSSHGRLKSSSITSRAQASKATPADVISWSACQDGQTSADTFSGGVAVGAMSNAFITALNNKPDQTYQELIRSLRFILNPRYSQKPQLSSSHHIDTNLRFIF